MHNAQIMSIAASLAPTPLHKTSAVAVSSLRGLDGRNITKPKVHLVVPLNPFFVKKHAAVEHLSNLIINSPRGSKLRS